MGGDKKCKCPAGTTVIADVKGGKAALFFTLLSILLIFGQDCACIQFCSGWNLCLNEIFVYNNTFYTVLSGVLSFIY